MKEYKNVSTVSAKLMKPAPQFWEFKQSLAITLFSYRIANGMVYSLEGMLSVNPAAMPW